MIQLDLFSQRPNPDFDGRTYKPKFDKARLTSQLKEVFDLMSDSKWRTLSEISNAINKPEASISARLRDFRKEKFGSHVVNSRRRGEAKKGLFEYQLIWK